MFLALKILQNQVSHKHNHDAEEQRLVSGCNTIFDYRFHCYVYSDDELEEDKGEPNALGGSVEESDENSLIEDEDSLSDIEPLPKEVDSGSEKVLSSDEKEKDSINSHDNILMPEGVDMFNGHNVRTPLHPTRFSHEEKRQHR